MEVGCLGSSMSVSQGGDHEIKRILLLLILLIIIILIITLLLLNHLLILLRQSPSQPWGFRLQGGKDRGLPFQLLKVSILSFVFVC